jgi:hypothetical protein
VERLEQKITVFHQGGADDDFFFFFEHSDKLV